MLSAALIALSLTASAFGTVFVTSPTASSTFTGGQNATISWQDNNASPSLTAFGLSKVGIYAGNAQQQTLLQQITGSVDVSKVNAIVFVPNPSIGPNSDEYFVRFDSLGLKDAASPQYPALAFSAKYTMSGMSGTFTAAVQAQINGQSSAPLAGGASSTAASVASSTSSSLTTLRSSSSASKTTSSTAKPSTSSSAASPKLASVGGAGIAGLFVFLTTLL